MATINFSAEHNHNISLKQAEEMTKRFRESKEKILNPDVDSNVLPFSETFSKYAFLAFMANENCKGIRIYYGMSDNLHVHAILVGVDGENRDILPDNPETATEDEVILEDGQRCPPYCSEPSPLNAS